MEFRLDQNQNFTFEERNLLIRYCVSKATRGKCSTKALYRPFKQKYLREAFMERRAVHRRHIQDYEKQAEEYDPATSQLPEALVAAFGGMPTKEQFAEYCAGLIKQERSTMRAFSHNYSVFVDYESTDKRLLAFHDSLEPRATFGYSNSLHEACDFAFDEEKRTTFLGALAEPPQWEGDWTHDWGVVTFGDMSLVYEDLELFRGETCILETVSHEQMLTVWLEDADLTALSREQGGVALVDKLRSLL